MAGVDHSRPGKKLKAAAAYWARGGPDDDLARDDLRAFGATEEQIVAALGPEEKHFEVWPENWPAWEAFLAVQTQWASGFNGFTGLDYSRVRAGLRAAGIRVTKDLWQKLQYIELCVLDEQSKSRRKK